MKKVLVMILTLVMIITLVACGAGKESTTGDNKQEASKSTDKSSNTQSDVKEPPAKVKWMLIEYSIIKYNNPLQIYKKLEEAGNIELEINPVPIDAYTDKFNIMLASKDMPDIMQLLDDNSFRSVKDLGPKGLFAPVSDYLDIMPNLKKWVDKYKSSLPAITAGDSKFYVIPKVKDYAPIYNGIALRTDKLEEANFDVNSIKTMDDLYAALKALQSVNGGKPVVSCRSNIGNLNVLARAFGTEFNSVYYDFDKKQYINPISTQNCKDAVQFFFNMRKDGILHPDWASMSDIDWNTKLNNSELLVFFDNMQNCDNVGHTIRQSDPDSKAKMESILPPQYNGKTYIWGLPPNLSASWAFVVSAKAESVEGILKAWDWLYDDANYDWINYGDEGITCQWNSEGYWVYKDNRSEEVLKLITDEYGIGQNENFYTVMKVDTFYNWPWMGKNNIFEQAVEKYKQFVYTELDPLNLMQFTLEENEKLKNIKVPLDTWISENITKFINGSRPMSEWDKFVTEVEGMNSAEVVKVYNDALSRIAK